MFKLNNLILIFLLLISLSVSADHPTDQSVQGAGITPDNVLWGLDKAIEQIQLLLTLDNTEKAKKGLEIAEERLLEVKAMIEANKLEAAEKAQREHRRITERVASHVKDIKKDNTEEELEEELEIENKLHRHRHNIEHISDELRVKIKIKGELTEEQRARLNALLDSFANSTDKVDIEIKVKKGITKVRIKSKGGNETEAEKRAERALKNIEERKERAQEAIDDAKEEINEAESEIGNVPNVLLNQAKEHLARAEIAFEVGRYGEAFGQAIAAKHLAKNAQKLGEREDEEVEEASDETENGNGEEEEVECLVDTDCKAGEVCVKGECEEGEEENEIEDSSSNSGSSREYVPKKYGGY